MCLATQSKKLLVERNLGTSECNRQNVRRNYWTRCTYLKPLWGFLDEVGLFHCLSTTWGELIMLVQGMVEGCCSENFCLLSH